MTSGTHFFVTHSEKKLSNTFDLRIPGERESNTAINDHRPSYWGQNKVASGNPAGN